MLHISPTIPIALLFAGAVLAGAPDAHAQEGGTEAGERGQPFPSKHYAPSEYGARPQNWAVTQDNRGITYVANNDGVLQYDGERWRLIPTATGTFVRSLAADSVVFVGAKGDFGYLRPDSAGLLRYQSLHKRADGPTHRFKDVWNTHVTGEGTYFQTNDWLFRWDGEQIDAWKSADRFHTSFVVEDRLYVRESGRGLLWMKKDSLTLAPGGGAFAETPIYMMTPYPNGKILVATQNKGLQLYEDGTLRSFAPALTSYLEEHDLYHGCRLPGDRYALATLGGGVLVVDSDGRLQRVLDAAASLPDQVVNAVSTGPHGQLWMALNNDGVYRVDLGSGTTLHDERTGLEGTLHQVHRHQGTLYVGTGRGLHVLKREDSGLGPGQGRFEKRRGLSIPWDFLSLEDTLLAATEAGTYRIDDGARKQIGGPQSYVLERGENGVVYAGTRPGLTVLKPTPSGWQSFVVDSTQSEFRSLVGRPNGRLWANTVDGTVLYYELSEDRRRVVEKETFADGSGLPDGYVSVTTVGGRVTAHSEEGLFQVKNPEASPSNWQFAAQSSLFPQSADPDTLSLHSAVEDESGALWVAMGNQVFRGDPASSERDDAWETVEPLHFPRSGTSILHVEGDSTVWLGAGQKLFRYAPRARDGEDPNGEVFRAHVRRVTALSSERLIYGGAPITPASRSSPTLPYRDNSLRFKVAAPVYRTTDAGRYQYRLVGHSDGWSDWQSQPSVAYTALWEGTYRFQVRARNEKGEISRTGTYSFRIRPPWYRSLWAYLLYGVGLLAIGIVTHQAYRARRERRRARRQARELEHEREARQQLKRANRRLREANQLKEEFLANTSHELRTPLTNILGFIDVLRDTATEEQQQFLDAIEKNGRRLERTLSALIDLSRLRSESGGPDLDPTEVRGPVHIVADQFREEADEKGVSLRVEAPDEPVYAKGEPRYLEQILRNLVENAVKFTNEGHVTISLAATDEHVRVAVADTGVGIDEAFIPELFDAFKQESEGTGRSHEGYGIGLALSSRMAELMEGDLEVESTKGEGSTFTLRLQRIAAPGREEGGTESVSDQGAGETPDS